MTNTQLARIEAIDSALLCKLTGGHTKCASEFNHLETGTWKLRHILSYHRLIYHHNILSRGGKETINKIYRKQKSNSVKGDWIKLLEKDFDFIGIQMNEEQIINTPKDAYKKEIKSLIQKAVFKYFMEIKGGHKKLENVKYEDLKIQPYITSKLFNQKERQLLYLMRSQCHNSKNNFKKMYRNDIKCSFGCNAVEDQIHIFTQCTKLKSSIKDVQNVSYKDIYSKISKQKEAI